MTVQHRHPRNVRVTIASLTARDFAYENTDSQLAMLMYDSAHYGHITTRGHVTLLKSGPRIAEARNQIVESFAKTDDDWLLMYDSDMVFAPNALYQLLDDAYDGGTQVKRHIVGGLCFAGSLRPGGRLFPTIYRTTQDEDGQVGTEIIYDYPKGVIVRVDATGGAFLLIHRSVFAKMSKPYPQGFGTMPNGKPNTYPWFIEGVNGGAQFGEDIAFCMRARALKFDVWVDTGCRTEHLKVGVLNEELYEQRRADLLIGAADEQEVVAIYGDRAKLAGAEEDTDAG